MRATFGLLVVVLAAASCLVEGRVLAAVKLRGNAQGVDGELLLEQLFTPTKMVKITGTITGLQANSKHGFHIHELGDIRTGCGATKGHYNPHNKLHGGPQDAIRHVGDLGNIVADNTGSVTVDISDSQVTLCGPYSVLGRAFVLHELEDDLGKGGNPGSLTTGNAGSRLACGVIGRTKPLAP